jgi:hypothetical protein
MNPVALLDWSDVSWADFIAGLEGYRDHYAPKSREDLAYLRCLEAMQGQPMSMRPAKSRELVGFLNTWACRLSSARAPTLIGDWLHARLDTLEDLEPLAITDPAVAKRAGALGALHDELIRDMRAEGLHNMGDAAASKTLHMLVPALFVMWDKEIRRSAPDGYGAYLVEMHRLARRLVEQAPVSARDLDEHLRRRLGYRVRKTLAKHLDEYNWYEAVGRERAAAR